MENNEIMNNEVIEVAEEVVTSSSSKVLKTLGAIGVAAVAGALTWKFVIKPIAAKIKSKKELKDYEPEDYDTEETELVETVNA